MVAESFGAAKEQFQVLKEIFVPDKQYHNDSEGFSFLFRIVHYFNFKKFAILLARAIIVTKIRKKFLQKKLFI